MSFRIEQDSIGKIKVPSKAYYGAQTQRAIQNFEIGWSMEFSLILPYIIVKKCAAKTNYAQKNISKKLSDAIIKPSKICALSSAFFKSNFVLLTTTSCLCSTK